LKIEGGAFGLILPLSYFPEFEKTGDAKNIYYEYDMAVEIK